MNQLTCIGTDASKAKHGRQLYLLDWLYHIYMLKRFWFLYIFFHSLLKWTAKKKKKKRCLLTSDKKRGKNVRNASTGKRSRVCRFYVRCPYHCATERKWEAFSNAGSIWSCVTHALDNRDVKSENKNLKSAPFSLSSRIFPIIFRDLYT